MITSLEEDLLTVLLGQQELYGLQISKAISEASLGTRSISAGYLYPTLRRLEEKELVTSRWDTNDSGNKRRGARRRYYRISPEGLKVLSENWKIRGNLLRWQPT